MQRIWWHVYDVRKRPEARQEVADRPEAKGGELASVLEDALTPGEKLFLDRRRRKEKLHEAARRLEVPVHCYRRWELEGTGAPEVKLRGITQGEQWVVLRRRMGLSQGELASACGCTQTDVTKLERGTARCKLILEFFGA